MSKCKEIRLENLYVILGHRGGGRGGLLMEGGLHVSYIERSKYCIIYCKKKLKSYLKRTLFHKKVIHKSFPLIKFYLRLTSF